MELIVIESLRHHATATDGDDVDVDLVEAMSLLLEEVLEKNESEEEITGWEDALEEMLMEAGVTLEKVSEAVEEVATRAGIWTAPEVEEVVPEVEEEMDTLTGGMVVDASDGHPYALVCRDQITGKVLSLEEVETRVAFMEGRACVYAEDFVEATYAEAPEDRAKALKELCPCHVRKDVEIFWNRTLEMIHDESPLVRYQALHNLCDGSPLHMEHRVVEALKVLHSDSDKLVSKTARRVLTVYRKRGDWNIM